jgi:hypothetical protein
MIIIILQFLNFLLFMCRVNNNGNYNNNKYMSLMGMPEGKRPLGRPRHSWMDIIKMNLGEVDYGSMD